MGPVSRGGRRLWSDCGVPIGLGGEEKLIFLKGRARVFVVDDYHDEEDEVKFPVLYIIEGSVEVLCFP